MYKEGGKGRWWYGHMVYTEMINNEDARNEEMKIQRRMLNPSLAILYETQIYIPLMLIDLPFEKSR
jgi:hypothetical protein